MFYTGWTKNNRGALAVLAELRKLIAFDELNNLAGDAFECLKDATMGLVGKCDAGCGYDAVVRASDDAAEAWNKLADAAPKGKISAAADRAFCAFGESLYDFLAGGLTAEAERFAAGVSIVAPPETTAAKGLAYASRPMPLETRNEFLRRVGRAPQPVIQKPRAIPRQQLRSALERAQAKLERIAGLRPDLEGNVNQLATCCALGGKVEADKVFETVRAVDESVAFWTGR
jgi:hypothetical protein